MKNGISTNQIGLAKKFQNAAISFLCIIRTEEFAIYVYVMYRDCPSQKFLVLICLSFFGLDVAGSLENKKKTHLAFFSSVQYLGFFSFLFRRKIYTTEAIH